MERGTISVQTENIFPIIKKFLYSDHEIFLRELISNAVDATNKLQKLASIDKFKGELGDLTIQIAIDKENKTLTISDRGIGLSSDEVKKYINQVAFSSAQEFLDKYKGVEDGKNIIGHFGLGFYSAFMVAEKVELRSRSWRKTDKGVSWTCDGSPEFTLDAADKKDRGTDIILHIEEEDYAEFLEESRIQGLLDKYCKFLPVEIQFGTKEETIKHGEGEDATEEIVSHPNIINNPSPAWTKKPAKLKDEDYKAFYRELYPYSEPPLFWIHLNVDYPFNLTGILYFPRLKKNVDVQRNKIQLYSNQVYVTDEVSEIVPEWLTLMHGVIDSPDIPLNVSRSYLQSDQNVKKINSYITKKVADRLEKLFKKDREDFEQKWEHISVLIKYGMMTDDKFYDRAKKFCLLQNLEGKYFTADEYVEHIKANQTDKNGKVIALYTNDQEAQDTYIQAAKNREYDILNTDNVIDNHFIGFLESKLENTGFVRIDSDTVDQIIDKDESRESVLSEKEMERLKELFVGEIDNSSVMVDLKALTPEDAAVSVVKPEMMRRMREMSAMNGMDFLSEQPEHYNVVVNSNHPVAGKILRSREENRKKIVRQLYDLALLSQGMLKGSKLTDFVNRSVALME